MKNESPLDVVEKLDAAFNRRDLDAVLSFYEDEATMVVEPGKIISGKSALKRVFEKIFSFNGVAKQQKMQVIEAHDIALFISRWTLSNQTTDENIEDQEFYATCVFRKNSDGKWRLVIDNSFGPGILET
jgi:uncharacterized protein (TIGR02246 family)